MHSPFIVKIIQPESGVARTIFALVDLEVRMVVARVLPIDPGFPDASISSVIAIFVNIDVDVIGPIDVLLNNCAHFWLQ